MAENSLAELAAARGTINLPVTAWINEWRAAGGRITVEALDRMYAAMRTDYATERRSDGKGRLRPSAIGNPCLRAQALSYLGAPAREDNTYEDAAQAGTLMHYWMQAEGISAGWLTDIEVEVDLPEWHLRGQMDGLCKDGSIFELKTMGSVKYQGLRSWATPVSKWTEPVREHVLQVTAYMYAAGATAASIIYMDRGDRAFREFRVPFDPNLFDQMDDNAKHILERVGGKDLPDRLYGCVMLQDGYDPSEHDESEVRSWLAGQRWCDFKDMCRTADPKEF